MRSEGEGNRALSYSLSTPHSGAVHPLVSEVRRVELGCASLCMIVPYWLMRASGTVPFFRWQEHALVCCLGRGLELLHLHHH